MTKGTFLPAASSKGRGAPLASRNVGQLFDRCPVGSVADEQPQFRDLFQFSCDGFETAQEEVAHREMPAHRLIQQWPNGVCKIRLTVVNDVVWHGPVAVCHRLRSN